MLRPPRAASKGRHPHAPRRHHAGSLGDSGPVCAAASDVLPACSFPDALREAGSSLFTLGFAGFPVERTAEDAWPQFRGWRINYEAAAYKLASGLDAVPAC